MATTGRTQIIAILIAFTLIGLMIFYVLEFHWIGNTFNAKKLVFWSFGLGLVAGIFISRYYTKSIEDSYDRMRISILIIFLFTLFGPFLGSLTNRLLSFQEIENQQFKFFDEKPIADLQIVSTEKTKPEAYFVFFMRNGKVERVKTSQRLFEGVEKGTTIQLPVKKGLFGFEIVCLD
jgi:hypothetical protein